MHLYSAPCLYPSINTVPFPFQFIDTLLGTLVKELQNKYTPGRRDEAIAVTRRFLRSVARVFVILSVEMASSKKKKYGTHMVYTFVVVTAGFVFEQSLKSQIPAGLRLPLYFILITCILITTMLAYKSSLSSLYHS